jgi:hypothetical protein
MLNPNSAKTKKTMSQVFQDISLNQVAHDSLKDELEIELEEEEGEEKAKGDVPIFILLEKESVEPIAGEFIIIKINII